MVPGTLKPQHCFFLLFVLSDYYLIFTRVFPLVGRNKNWGASDQSLELCAAAIEFCVKSADMMMAARNSQPFCLLPQHSKLQREMMKVNIWAICSGLSLDYIPVYKSVGWTVISASKSWKVHFFYCICRHFTRWTLTAIPKLHYKANIPEMFMSIYLFIIKLIAHAFWLQGMYHDTILQQWSTTRQYENRIIFVPLSVLTLLVKWPDPLVRHTRDAHHFRDAAESRHHFSERFPAFLHTDQDWGLHPRTLCKKVTQPHSLLTPL